MCPVQEDLLELERLLEHGTEGPLSSGLRALIQKRMQERGLSQGDLALAINRNREALNRSLNADIAAGPIIAEVLEYLEIWPSAEVLRVSWVLAAIRRMSPKTFKAMSKLAAKTLKDLERVQSSIVDRLK